MTRSFRRIAIGLVVGTTLTVLHTGSVGCARLVAQPAPAVDAQREPIPIVERAVASEPELRRAYEFAAHHESIVRYIPCFCGCETVGHKSVESCFVSSRTPEGAVKWNKHGAACRHCLDVVKAARELLAAGHPVKEIRRQIVERFYKKHITPTPPVPVDHAMHAPVRPGLGSSEHRHR